MLSVAHTMPMLIRETEDFDMLETCLQSLAQSDPGGLLVLFNQGNLSNEGLRGYLGRYHLHSIILGQGTNVGIAQGRQACFRYLWTHHPEISYITEIHVDMIFPPNWLRVLLDYLENHDEPMICPGILTSKGELHPEGVELTIPCCPVSLTAQGELDLEGVLSYQVQDIPVRDVDKMSELLNKLTYPAVVKGFVHPVMHRVEALKAVGGYDTALLTGLQGYEDDSLLLGYRYYLGTRHNWIPKCCIKTRVYHATMVQRDKIRFDPGENLKGLLTKYGIEGIKELSKIYPRNEEFQRLLKQFGVIGPDH